MEDKKPSTTVEDYLGVIYTMERDGEHVIGARLAEALDVSAPTVTITLKRMQRDGWITMDERSHIAFTQVGREAAKSVIRRHMLTEWMLARVLKLPLSEIHKEAHNIEHSISKEVEDMLYQEMDHPEKCPHGNPMPGFEDTADAYIPLHDVREGMKVIIERIHENAEEQTELMRFFEENGIKPGAEGFIKTYLPFNGTMTLEVAKNVVTLGENPINFIFVSLK